MQDIAALVANQSRGTPQIRRGPVDFTRPSLYLGDPTHAKVLATELGLTLRPLAVQVADTLAWLLARNRSEQDKIKKVGIVNFQ
jgi:hypothetical protein